jgi:hypothetical protein
MFLSMAALGLTTFALLALHSPAPSLSSGPSEECSPEARAAVWAALPECRPRPTLVPVPLPADPTVLQVGLVYGFGAFW